MSNDAPTSIEGGLSDGSDTPDAVDHAFDETSGGSSDLTGKSVSRLFLFEVVQGIRLSALAEEDGSNWANCTAEEAREAEAQSEQQQRDQAAQLSKNNKNKGKTRDKNNSRNDDDDDDNDHENDDDDDDTSKDLSSSSSPSKSRTKKKTKKGKKKGASGAATAETADARAEREKKLEQSLMEHSQVFLTRSVGPANFESEPSLAPMSRAVDAASTNLLGIQGLTTADCALHKKWTLRSQPTKTGERLEIELKTYAPAVFQRLRKLRGISTDRYCSAWNFHITELPEMKTGAGRSGSLFLASADRRFLFKTLPYAEVKTLLSILPMYTVYLAQNPDSLLLPIFGLLRFSDPRAVVGYLYLVVFPNTLYSKCGATIDEKYDFKGRTPKKGKAGRYTVKNVDAHSYVFKDNDAVDRKFYVSTAQREQLVGILRRDVNFLQSLNCMDYSLLVGVHKLTSADMVKIRRTEMKKASVGRSGSPTTTVTAAAAASSSSSSPSSSSSSRSRSPKRRSKRSSGASRHSRSRPSTLAVPSSSSSSSASPARSVPSSPRASSKGHRRSSSSSTSSPASPAAAAAAASSSSSSSSRHSKGRKGKHANAGDDDASSSPTHPLEPLTLIDDDSEASGSPSRRKPKRRKSRDGQLRHSSESSKHRDRHHHRRSANRRSALASPTASSSDGSPTALMRSRSLDSIQVPLPSSSMVDTGYGCVGTQQESYFVSIIDFLSRYNMAKKGANFFKSFLWDQETLSTVPPDFYGERWLKFMEGAFVATDQVGVVVVSSSKSRRNARRSRQAKTEESHSDVDEDNNSSSDSNSNSNSNSNSDSGEDSHCDDDDDDDDCSTDKRTKTKSSKRSDSDASIRCSSSTVIVED